MSVTKAEFTKELAALIRSRQPLVYLVSSEEKRVIEYFRNYTVAGSYRTFLWDCYNGLINIKSMEPSGAISSDDPGPTTVLDWIIKEAAQEEAAARKRRADAERDADSKAFRETDRERDEREKDEGITKGNIYILLDFHRFLNGIEPDIERRLRTLARMDANSVIIMVGPHYVSTPALEKDMRVIDFPPPNDAEIKKSLYKVVDSVSDKLPNLRADTESREKDIINSVKGLTQTELAAAFGKSVCMHRTMHIPTILKEKQEVIRKTGILEYFQPDVDINDVGGLDNLIDFLKLRKSVFTDEARAFGIPNPKGCLILGVPGTGKSMSAKAAASLFNQPLLRLDFGSLFKPHVGESEASVRTALKIADQLAPCVLWCDEIEKGLSGNQSSGRTDSGVTSRVVSTLLTWLQEKTAPVFVICTANQHDQIPAEFMRAGRFDEIFFVDVPTRGERMSIVEKLIKRKKRNPKDFDLHEISLRSEGYTGAELEKAIDMGLLTAFQDKSRLLKTQDVTDALVKFKPLTKMRPEIIEAMRAWAEGRCIKANSPEPTPGSIDGTKELDLD
jgi:SpoVK/Ycf46/Vps4 family AAA+-type ATPase